MAMNSFSKILKIGFVSIIIFVSLFSAYIDAQSNRYAIFIEYSAVVDVKPLSNTTLEDEVCSEVLEEVYAMLSKCYNITRREIVSLSNVYLLLILEVKNLPSNIIIITGEYIANVTGIRIIAKLVRDDAIIGIGNDGYTVLDEVVLSNVSHYIRVYEINLLQLNEIRIYESD